MEAICDPENIEAVLRAVVRNKGSPGVDGITVRQLPGILKARWPEIEQGKPAENSGPNGRSVASGREARAVLGALKDASRRGAVASPSLTAPPRRAPTRQVGSGKWSRQSHQEMLAGDTAPPADETGTSGHMMCYVNRTS